MCWLNVGYFSTIQTDYGWSLALGGTFIFLLSSALTLTYILFYSTGPAKMATLEILNYCGILVLIYFLGYVLLALEYGGKPQQGAFQFIFSVGLIGSILIVCLVNLKISPYVAFIWTSVILLYAIAFDYYNYADSRQKDYLYTQLYIYAWLIFIATIFFVLHLPERCCPRTRFAYYFLSGKVWL